MKSRTNYPLLMKTIAQSLADDNTELNQRKWAEHILAHRLEPARLLPLLLSENKVAMHFSWLLGGLCDSQPQIMYPSVEKMFRLRGKVRFPNFDRSLAKLFYLAGIPPAIEAEAVNELFSWLGSAQTGVSTKNFCLKTLLNLVKKYPDLRHELVAVLNDQLNKNTPAFSKQCKKALNSLNGREIKR